MLRWSSRSVQASSLPHTWRGSTSSHSCTDAVAVVRYRTSLSSYKYANAYGSTVRRVHTAAAAPARRMFGCAQDACKISSKALLKYYRASRAAAARMLKYSRRPPLPPPHHPHPPPRPLPPPRSPTARLLVLRRRRYGLRRRSILQVGARLMHGVALSLAARGAGAGMPSRSSISSSGSAQLSSVTADFFMNQILIYLDNHIRNLLV